MVCTTVFTVVTRLSGIFFLIAAAFTIPEAWKLNESNYTLGGDGNHTLFVPIEICDKRSISIRNGPTMVFNGDFHTNNCHSLEYLINACVASIFFAGAAMLIFFVFDLLARYSANAGVSRSAVLGMSFFLTFILIQAGACCYALYMECEYWEDFFTDRFGELTTNMTTTTDVTEVQTHGNKLYFIGTCLLAALCALVFCLDTLLQYCTVGKSDKTAPKTSKAKNDAPSEAKKDEPEDSSSAPSSPPPPRHTCTAASVNTGSVDDGYSFAQDSAIDDESRNTKKWTNY